jgi:hypothetical protein
MPNVLKNISKIPIIKIEFENLLWDIFANPLSTFSYVFDFINFLIDSSKYQSKIQTLNNHFPIIQ